MTALTSRERILRLFANQDVDRPALKVWGAIPGLKLLHPAYQPFYDMAMELTDIFDGFDPDIEPICGANRHLYESVIQDTDDPLWKDQYTTLHTPKGDLYEIYRFSTIGAPGYMIRHMVQDEEDLEKLLSVPYEPTHFTCLDAFELRKAQLGNRGVVMIGIPHAGYTLQMKTGSENLAILSVDCRELVEQAIGSYAQRILDYVKEILSTGVKAPFSWYGPEVLTPPLMTPRDFTDFVYRFDKPICDAIHEAGGYVWVHCHGKVAKLLDQWIDMGVDILNPLEPPKNGDVDLNAVISKYGRRIGWEGNIEIQEILLSSPERVRQLIYDCVEAGAPSGRFILCPSTGFNEYPYPTEQYLSNFQTYIRYGLERLEAHRN